MINNKDYTHYAVHKGDMKIVNGWDYSDYEPSQLRSFKKDYFDVDLEDMGFNPKDFCIWTYKHCVAKGIDPNDDANWSNGTEYMTESKKYLVKIMNENGAPSFTRMTLREGIEFQKIAQRDGIKYTVLEGNKKPCNRRNRQKKMNALIDAVTEEVVRRLKRD